MIKDYLVISLLTSSPVAGELHEDRAILALLVMGFWHIVGAQHVLGG